MSINRISTRLLHAYVVLIDLCDRLNRPPSQREFAEALGCSTMTACLVVRDLRDAGFVTSVLKGVRTVRPLYRFILHVPITRKNPTTGIEYPSTTRQD